MNGWEQRLEAIRNELRKQDEQWRRNAEALAHAGEIVVAVPTEMLEALEAPVATSPGFEVPAAHGIRA